MTQCRNFLLRGFAACVAFNLHFSCLCAGRRLNNRFGNVSVSAGDLKLLHIALAVAVYADNISRRDSDRVIVATNDLVILAVFNLFARKQNNLRIGNYRLSLILLRKYRLNDSERNILNDFRFCLNSA